MEAAIITTYRCQNECHMCGIWKHQTAPVEEFKPELLKKLPDLDFCNVTGGEPFLRDDIEEIVSILSAKSKRVVISTNGYYTDKILGLAKKNKKIGFRVSLEGLPRANDKLRGITDGFDRGLRSLLELGRLGVKDIGFGITISDANARDLIELYQLAKSMGLEFATAAVHNSFYFHKQDNRIADKEMVTSCLRELIRELMRSPKIKDWFRAYFNHGLINYVNGAPRLLECGAGRDIFFLDPFARVLPCNGMEEGKFFESFGNLREDSFARIWTSPKAEEIRKKIKCCPKNCWMIGTAAPAMKRRIWKPLFWIAAEFCRPGR